MAIGLKHITRSIFNPMELIDTDIPMRNPMPLVLKINEVFSVDALYLSI